MRNFDKKTSFKIWRYFPLLQLEHLQYLQKQHSPIKVKIFLFGGTVHPISLFVHKFPLKTSN